MCRRIFHLAAEGAVRLPLIHVDGFGVSGPVLETLAAFFFSIRERGGKSQVSTIHRPYFSSFMGGWGGGLPTKLHCITAWKKICVDSLT